MEINQYNELLDLFQKKNFTDIEKKYLLNFAKYKENIKILNFFAVYYLGKSNFAEVQKCLELAENLDKNNYNTVINFANLYICKKNSNKAIPYLETAIKLNQNISYPLKLLANIFLKQKKLISAKKLFIKLARLDKENMEHFLSIADIMFEEGKYLSSIKFYLIPLNKNKKNAKVYLGLANCYFKLDNLKQAIDYLDEGIKIFPKVEVLYLRKNEILRSFGNFHEALKTVNLGLSIAPHNTSLIFAKSKLVSYEKFSNEINSYELLFNSIPNNMQKSILGFALFKIFNDIKEYKRASTYLDEANRIKFGLTNYSLEVENEQFDFLKNNFNKDYIEKYTKSEKIKKKGPIFILGMQRSGSTLLEQMLAAHSKTNSLGETDLYPLCFQKFIDDFDLSSFKKSLINLSKKNILELGKIYLKKTNFSENFISIDKLLSNFKLIGPILMSLPDAKIIHTYRNPTDVCFSIYSNFFNTETMPWSSDQKSIINYYKQYLLLMRHWNNLFPKKILNISYEGLVENPSAVLKLILDFCELSWEENCLEFHKNKNKVETESLMQVRSRIYKSSIQKYNPYQPYYEDFFSKLNFKNIF